MGRRRKLDIIEHIKDLSKMEQGAAEAQLEAAFKDPAIAAQKIDELLAEFKDKGPADFLLNDPEYAKFLFEMERDLSASFLVAMKLAGEALVKTLQTNGQYCTAKDLSGIINDLQRVVKSLNEQKAIQEPGDMGQAVAELDTKIAQLEKEMREVEGVDLDS